MWTYVDNKIKSSFTFMLQFKPFRKSISITKNFSFAFYCLKSFKPRLNPVLRYKIIKLKVFNNKFYSIS